VLADQLRGYADRPDAVVLALPRGGVPVGAEVAAALRLPLDVLVVRKLGVPRHEELAMGAVADGITMRNDDVIASCHVTDEEFEQARRRELAELDGRERSYRQDRDAEPVGDRTVILVDDGLATGASMRSAIAALRQRAPRAIIVGVPVAARPTRVVVAQEADDMICPYTPTMFRSVGEHYRRFDPTTDDEVRRLLSSQPTR
jgi:predicted phosphoribosyltransferase